MAVLYAFWGDDFLFHDAGGPKILPGLARARSFLSFHVIGLAVHAGHEISRGAIGPIEIDRCNRTRADVSAAFLRAADLDDGIGDFYGRRSAVLGAVAASRQTHGKSASRETECEEFLHRIRHRTTEGSVPVPVPVGAGRVRSADIARCGCSALARPLSWQA